MEWIVENKQDAIDAEKHGASRLELISDYAVGGLTPSTSLVKQVVSAVSIPVQVMIRPHPYSFFYSQDLKNKMLQEIKMLKNHGIHRIVVGSITHEGKIDRSFIEDIIHVNDQVDMTFHRAFDKLSDLYTGYRDLIPYIKNVRRILTSGGQENSMKGLESLKELVKLQRDTNGPVIMPGSGLTDETIEYIHCEIHADTYHFGTGVRVDHSIESGFDLKKIRYIEQVLNRNQETRVKR